MLLVELAERLFVELLIAVLLFSTDVEPFTTLELLPVEADERSEVFTDLFPLLLVTFPELLFPVEDMDLLPELELEPFSPAIEPAPS